MCLVSYIPLEKGEFLITSNRDESPKRMDKGLQHEVIGRHAVVYPPDVKGGSWIFASHQGDVICLLNGAFDLHTHEPPYKMSRGQMMKDYFTYESPVQFLKNFDFVGMEPFTMIIRNGAKFFEVRWDEKLLHIEILDQRLSYIWSSTTLYTQEAIKSREDHFREMLGKENQSSQSILEIHRTGMSDDTYDGFIMNREDRVATLSITQAQVTMENATVTHANLSTGDQEKISLKKTKD